MKNINWYKLGKATKDSFKSLFILLIFAFIITLPVLLAIYTGKFYWIALYSLVFLVGEIWNNYNR